MLQPPPGAFLVSEGRVGTHDGNAEGVHFLLTISSLFIAFLSGLVVAICKEEKITQHAIHNADAKLASVPY
jgi:hypothetical protein